MRVVKSISLCWVLTVSFACTHTAAFAAQQRDWFSLGLPKSYLKVPQPPDSRTDLTTTSLSPDALQLSGIIGISEKLHRIQDLADKSKSISPSKLEQEEREEFRDLKEEVRESIERTRLEIEYTLAEVKVDQAIYGELVSVYSADRNLRVAKLNAAGFTLNGALWAASEALEIPSYRSPRLSIPSGALGIVAGVVPSLFSLYALKDASGSRFACHGYPNMLSKPFGYTTDTKTNIPDHIWSYMNSVPPDSGVTQTRIERLVERWLNNPNVRTYTDVASQTQRDRITGHAQCTLTIDLLDDRLLMLNEMQALIHRINRPLLELMLVLQGEKRI